MSTNQPYQLDYADQKTKPTHKFMTIDNKVHEIHDVVVYRRSYSEWFMDDYPGDIAQDIVEWMKTDVGKWVREHSIDEPIIHKNINHLSATIDVALVARLKDIDNFVYALKYR